MITRHDIAIAEYIIDTSGVVDILLDGRRRSNRGRKTNRDHWRLYLLGGLLTVQECGNFVIRDVHETLVRRLPLEERFRLGVCRMATDPSTGEPYPRYIDVEDLNNVTASIRRSYGYGRASGECVDEHERERRRAVIRSYCDALMDVFDLGWTSSTYALDATGVWSWARGKAKPDKATKATKTTRPPAPDAAAA